MFIFSELDNLILEQMHRTSDLGWICNICGKSSAKKNNITSHIEAIHMQTGGFHCDVCSKVFKTRDSLRHHTKTCLLR